MSHAWSYVEDPPARGVRLTHQQVTTVGALLGWDPFLPSAAVVVCGIDGYVVVCRDGMPWQVHPLETWREKLGAPLPAYLTLKKE